MGLLCSIDFEWFWKALAKNTVLLIVPCGIEFPRVRITVTYEHTVCNSHVKTSIWGFFIHMQNSH